MCSIPEGEDIIKPASQVAFRAHQVLLAATALSLISVLTPAAARDGPRAAGELEEVTPRPTVQGIFAGTKPPKPATDLSGIACRPGGHGATLDCLVVNDEGKVAQRVSIGDGILRPGQIIPLIGDAPSETAFGRSPTVDTCPGVKGKFKEFDGEAVTFGATSPSGDGFFYVVGSHGCSRKEGEFRLSSFLLARLRADGSGNPGPVELTWRLSAALRNAPSIGKYFARSLKQNEQGLNIEGIAVGGGRLLVGLRAPSLHGNAFIVSVSIAELFAPGLTGSPTVRDQDVFSIPLGKDVGIRDLAALPDGRLLVLSGPAHEQSEVPYAVNLVQLKQRPAISTVRSLGRIPDIFHAGDRFKAEAITIISKDRDALRHLQGPRCAQAPRAVRWTGERRPEGISHSATGLRACPAATSATPPGAVVAGA